MQPQGIILANNSTISVQSAPVGWPGGRAALVNNAASYGAGLQLQVQGPSGAWLNIGSAVSADGVQSFDAPAGQYRLSGSSASGVFANLVMIPY